jgi:hypothetical protein
MKNFFNPFGLFNCTKDNHHKPLEEIQMKLSELLAINTGIAGQLSKIETEVVTHAATLQAAIDNLTAQLADVVLTDEQAQSVNAVIAAAQRLDDLNPDAVVEEPEAPAEGNDIPPVDTGV